VKNLHIEFEIPTFLAQQAGLDATDVSAEARRLLARFLYEHGRISRGKACELTGLSTWEFAELNQQWDIKTRYCTEDLNEDLQRLVDV